MDNVIYIDFVNKKRIKSEQAPTEPIRPKSDKQLYFEELMSRGMVTTVSILDHPEVKFPEHLKQDFIVLKWSYRFVIPDLTIGSSGISGTLTFSQKPHFVNIPWESVLEMYLTNSPKDSRREWRPDAT
jgi:hypothetical protein